MVIKQPGANTIETNDEIRRLLPSFQAQLPPRAVERPQRPVQNDSRVVPRHQVTMFITLGLVILVIFLFLRNASATMIPAMALPFSIVGTFAVMYLLNYSLDNLSLMALILSVGFVVDDAIVMLENIVRHMERGEGADGIGFPRVEGDRLHDRLDDGLAGGGIYSGAVYGGTAGPPVPRICRYHLRGHSDFRRGFDHADADAVQPVPAAHPSDRRLVGSRRPSDIFDGMLRLYDGSLGGCCAIVP